MDIHARRFNALFKYRWDRIVDFLKLHYVLSRRTEPYWLAQRASETIPVRLSEHLALWREQPPSAWDFSNIDEVFPAASHDYVLYGMGFPCPLQGRAASPDAVARIAEVQRRARALVAALPANRAYYNQGGAAPGRDRPRALAAS
jgi:tryptophan 7-halogenase